MKTKPQNGWCFLHWKIPQNINQSPKQWTDVSVCQLLCESTYYFSSSRFGVCVGGCFQRWKHAPTSLTITYKGKWQKSRQASSHRHSQLWKSMFSAQCWEKSSGSLNFPSAPKKRLKSKLNNWMSSGDVTWAVCGYLAAFSPLPLCLSNHKHKFKQWMLFVTEVTLDEVVHRQDPVLLPLTLACDSVSFVSSLTNKRLQSQIYNQSPTCLLPLSEAKRFLGFLRLNFLVFPPGTWRAMLSSAVAAQQPPRGRCMPAQRKRVWKMSKQLQ